MRVFPAVRRKRARAGQSGEQTIGAPAYTFAHVTTFRAPSSRLSLGWPERALNSLTSGWRARASSLGTMTPVRRTTRLLHDGLRERQLHLLCIQVAAKIMAVDNVDNVEHTRSQCVLHKALYALNLAQGRSISRHERPDLQVKIECFGAGWVCCRNWRPTDRFHVAPPEAQAGADLSSRAAGRAREIVSEATLISCEKSASPS